MQAFDNTLKNGQFLEILNVIVFNFDIENPQGEVKVPNG